MGMSINTNIAANNSYRNLTNTQNDLSKSLEKLSSGLRINRAADDAAGLAISHAATDGYLYVTDSIGDGQMFKIDTHASVASSGSFVVPIRDEGGVRTALRRGRQGPLCSPERHRGSNGRSNWDPGVKARR